MIGNAVKSLLVEKQENFVIPGENVANVMDVNPLTHALLVLTKVRYTKIPVLNKEGKIVGLVGLNDIVDAMFDLTEIDPDKLSHLTVADVMETEVPTVQEPLNIEYILHEMVDHPFIAVVDKDDTFAGIITRKELLKAVNHMAHELEGRYEVIEKEGNKQKVM